MQKIGDMNKRLQAIRALEERLKYASPDECARLTKELVKLKDNL